MPNFYNNICSIKRELLIVLNKFLYTQYSIGFYNKARIIFLWGEITNSENFGGNKLYKLNCLYKFCIIIIY